MLTRPVTDRIRSTLLAFLTGTLLLPCTAFGDEILNFYRTPEAPAPDLTFSTPRLKPTVALNQNGDLQIQYGRTAFIVAYSSPVDRFKPSEQPPAATREQQSSAINGISLTACLTF